MLRSSTELIRYDVDAVDGKIGRVRDFYFDDRAWVISFIVVDTDGLFSDDRILVQPQQVREFLLPSESMVLDLPRSKVEEGGGRAMFPSASGQLATADSPPASAGDGHVLHSVAQITEFAVTGKADKIGYVRGLLIETTTWSIRYLIVDTGHWLPGKLVLLSPLAVERIDWDGETVITDVTREGVENCPPYDIDSEISREYEAFLHDYYGWEKYWH